MDREASYWSIIPHAVLAATDIKPNAKLLYAKVTSLQGQKGYCYASNKHLAAGLGISPDTVTRLLRELADAGYLAVDIVRDDQNAVVERRVYPTIKIPRVKLQDPPGQTSDTLPDERPIPSRTNVRLENKAESKGENPPKAPQGGKRERAEKSVPNHKPERFEAFWKAYPRHESRIKAVQAWDKLKPDDALLDIMARALKRQLAREDWQRGIGTPYASTWLNNRRWEDGDVTIVQQQSPQYDPRGGLQAW